MKLNRVHLSFLAITSTAVLASAAAPESRETPESRQTQAKAIYNRISTISIPGGLTGFDISWVDSANARYYLADRGNATASPVVPPRIDVIDTEHDKYVTSVVLTAGANGVVAIPRAHELWTGLADSTVAVIDTDANAVKQIIHTAGTKRADELAYDPADHLVLIANDQDSPPFVSLIDTETYTVVKRITYDGISAPESTGGIEQPVWDGPRGKFYIAIPATRANPNGEVDEIDPHEMTVTRSNPTACTGPAGLVLIPNQRLMTSCGDVIDIAAGTVLSTVRGVGGDEIWYNPGDERVYFGGGTNRISVDVVDTSTNLPIAVLTVGQILVAPAVSQTTHSVAADSANNHIYVPTSGVGVEVWKSGSGLKNGQSRPSALISAQN
jgi:DNA-binding beta-propeller fold protein YncE